MVVNTPLVVEEWFTLVSSRVVGIRYSPNDDIDVRGRTPPSETHVGLTIPNTM